MVQTEQKKDETKESGMKKKDEIKKGETESSSTKKKDETNSSSKQKKVETKSSSEQKKNETQSSSKQKNDDAKSSSEIKKDETKSSSKQNKDEAKSSSEQKKNETQSSSKQKKDDAKSSSEIKKDEAKSSSGQKKDETKSSSGQKKDETKSSSGQKKDDAKSSSGQKKDVTKSSSEQKKDETKSSSEQKKNETKSSSGQKKDETKSSSEQKKDETKSSSEQKKNDTKSSSEQKKDDAKSSSEQKKDVSKPNSEIQNNATKSNSDGSKQNSTTLKENMKTLLKAIQEKDETSIQSMLNKLGVAINQDFKESDKKFLESPLVKAASIDCQSTLDMLIKHGADVNKPAMDEHGTTPLFMAASSGHLKNVKILVENGADANQKIKNQEYTALHVAAKVGNNDIVNYLLDCKVDVNIWALNGSPLLRAVLYNKASTVKLLLDRGADINKHVKANGTALWRSVFEKDKAVMCILLEKKADVNLQSQSDNSTPLFRAIRSDWNEGVEILIKNKADVNISSDDMTPLCRAVKNGNVKNVKLLLDNGADVNGVSTNKQTAMDMAIELKSKKEIVTLLQKSKDDFALKMLDDKETKILDKMEYLLSCIERKDAALVKQWLEKSGTHVNDDIMGKDDNYLQPPLNKAATVDNQEILPMLIKHGALVNKIAKDEDGYTPLYLAASYGCLENVKILLENKADVNLQIKYLKYSPLHGAAGKGHTAVLKYLLQQNPNINSMGTQGTPLYRAVIYNKFSCAKILIDNKADVNMHVKQFGTPLWRSVAKQDKINLGLLLSNGGDINLQSQSDNSTPLFKAVNANWEEGVQLLLERKADVNKSNDTMPPLCRAVRNKNKNIVQLLLSNGADINALSKSKQTALKMAEELKVSKEIIDLLKQEEAKSKLEGNSQVSQSIDAKEDEKLEFTTNKILFEDMKKLEASITSKDVSAAETIVKKIKKDINKNIKSESGDYLQPPLTIAASIECEEMLRMLIKYGASVNKHAEDSNGFTPLYNAAKASILKNVKVLVENGATVNKQIRHFKYSPLHTAAGQSNEEIVKYLLDNGADVNIMGEPGTPLYKAVLYNKHNNAKLILDKGADINKHATTSGTPLWRSVAEKDKEMMTLLLDYNADVNMQSLSDNSTALFKALLLNWDEGVEILLERSADPNIANNLMPPLCRAVRNKNKNNVKLLLEYGADVNGVSKSSQTALEMVDLVLDLEVKASIISLLTNPPAAKKKKERIEKSENSELVRMATISPVNGSDVEKKDVMLSYQWDHQKEVIKIKNYLENTGKLKVWMDIQDMHGGMNARMAEAVDNSTVIVFCMSEAYANSRNCRKEYRYADFQAKDIIPIKMETNFSPTIVPELSIIICNQLYYDFGSDEKLQKELPNLLNAIKKFLQFYRMKAGYDQSYQSNFKKGKRGETYNQLWYITQLAFLNIKKNSSGQKTQRIWKCEKLEQWTNTQTKLQQDLTMAQIDEKNDAADLNSKQKTDENKSNLEQKNIAQNEIKANSEQKNDPIKSSTDESKKNPSTTALKGYMRALLKAINKKDETTIQNMLNKLGGAINQDFKESDKKFLESPLVKAASIDCQSTLDMLIKHGADVNKPAMDEHGTTPLFMAASTGHLKNLKILVENGADVNQKIKNEEYSALHAAAKIGNNDIINYLLDNKTDVNIMAANGTSLSRAVLHNKASTVKLLLDRGADVNKHVKQCVTPLWRSANEKDKAVMCILLERNADVNLQSQSDNSTPLFRAIRSDWNEGAEILIKNKADVNISSDDMSPLCRAVKNGNAKMINLLLDNDADVKAVSKSKQTAIDMAKEMKSNKNIIDLFLKKSKKDADLRMLDDEETKMCEKMECLLKYIESNDVIMVRKWLEKLSKHVNDEIIGKDKKYLKPPLHKAIIKNNNEILSMLVHNGALVNKQDDAGNTPLYLAALCGHLENVKILVENKADVDLQIKQKEDSPLHIAVGRGHTTIIEYLLKQGADINLMNTEGTPLYLAVDSNRMSCVKLLIDNNADVNMYVEMCGTPLWRGVAKKDKNVIELLLNNEADVDLQKERDNSTPLYKAVDLKWEEGVKLLIANAADINISNNDYPPLSRAVLNKSKNIVELLLSNGADINALSKSNLTALQLAIKCKAPKEIIDLLKQYEVKANLARIDLDDKSTAISEKMEYLLSCIELNDTARVKIWLAKLSAHINDDVLDKNKRHLQPPLHKASKKNNQEILSMLINHGALVNKLEKDKDGYTPLYLAVHCGHLENVKILVKNKAEVNLQIKSKQDAPLHAAARNGHTDVLNYLLQQNADVNVMNTEGTSLYTAVDSDQISCVKILLDNNADINKYVKQFSTPLCRSVAKKKKMITDLLLTNGANINLQSQRDNSTPLYTAVEVKWEEGVKLLIEKKADVNLFNNLRPPLCRAVQLKNKNIIQLLLSNGADINLPNLQNNSTSLYTAVEEGWEEGVRLLIEQKADVNITNNDYPPLSRAVLYKSKNIVELLLNNGADVNALSKSNLTSMELAIKYKAPKEIIDLLKRYEVKANLARIDMAMLDDKETKILDKMEYLLNCIEANDTARVKIWLAKLSAHINDDVVGKDGNYLPPPLNKSAINQEILLMLVNHGALVNKVAKDKDGYTPLYLAVYCGHLENVKILVKNKAEVNLQIKSKQDAPLHAAARNGHTDVLNYLLQQNADVNVMNTEGTPLDTAVNLNKISCVKILLANNADVNMHVKQFGTPLLKSVVKKNKTIVNLLLINSVNINLQSGEDNSTPLSKAVHLNWEEGVKLLLAKTADVNISDNTMPPLCRAVHNKNKTTVQLLLNNGADINALSKSEQTALQMAEKLQVSKEIIDLLKQYEAKSNLARIDLAMLDDKETKMSDKMDYLLKSIEGNDVSRVKTWLEKLSAHINDDTMGKDNNYLQPPLHKAATVNNQEILSMLIKHGAFVDKLAKDEDGHTPLYLAASYGCLENVKILLEHKADVNLQIKYLKYSPLHGAAGKGHTDVLKYLIQQNANINLMGTQGTPLYRAVIYNKCSCAKILIDNKADVNMHVRQFGTPLWRSVAKKEKSNLSLLLNNGANINWQGGADNSTSLFQAVNLNWEEGVKLLLEKKADVNISNNVMPSLCRAVQNKNKNIVQLLLKNGADINALSKSKQTALNMAEELKVSKEIIDQLKQEELLSKLTSQPSNNTDAKKVEKTSEFTTNKILVEDMKKLEASITSKDVSSAETIVKKIKKDINKNIKSESGDYLQPPLTIAASIECEEMLRMLIKYGASVNKHAEDNNGFTPLYKAAKASILKNVKVLVEKGATVNKQINYFKYSTLHAAAGKVNEEIVKYLLDNGADINIMGEQGTPLYRAVLYNKYNHAKLILDKGADINKHATTSGTPLWRSVAEKDKAMMTLLLDYNADVDMQSQSDNSTALFKAVSSNWEEGVEILLERNADPNIANNLMPPLCAAVRNKNDKVVKLLLEYGADRNGGSQNKQTPLQMADLIPDVEVKTNILGILNNPPVVKKKRKHSIEKITETSELVRMATKSPVNGSDVEKKDVMLSYQWNHQKEVIEIKNYLENTGKLKVWMDIQDMHGGMNARMAEAVDNSTVIVFCMSEAYANSRNCRKEYRYADFQAKDIIPIKMETSFSPTLVPELSIIICNQLYYDFGSDEKLKKELPNLLNAIKKLL
ncbi:uncharacterized protein LOC130630100 [Hydractinia symbiolongicarpus]|uniref:uncharacterized protein LOC130630100 n=1 Tax=Hydractinia symbiolongicarpus TaxID=13093 RepID=UPI002551334B|nr:uncharacterized protein LOC130630100 [Hydractinia symbiolongicarpus]